MTHRPTLVETEQAMRSHVESLALDFAAAHAVSSIYRAANAVRAHVRNEVLRPYGLSWTGFVVLWVVWIFDGMETRHAAEAAAISKATLTGVAKTLETRGWLTRTGRADDRRLVELNLTDQGRALMEEVYPRLNALESKVVSKLTGKRTAELTRGLRDIVTTIEQLEDKP